MKGKRNAIDGIKVYTPRNVICQNRFAVHYVKCIVLNVLLMYNEKKSWNIYYVIILGKLSIPKVLRTTINSAIFFLYVVD